MAERKSRSASIFTEKIIQLSSFFFGGTADLALPFTGMKTGSLVLKSLYFFGRRNIDVILDGFFIFYPAKQKGGHPDPPSPCFGLDFIFITYVNVL